MFRVVDFGAKQKCASCFTQRGVGEGDATGVGINCSVCQDNLHRLWRRIKQYEAQHGHLPEATFYPEHPGRDEDSLAFLLGSADSPHFVCPTIREDLHRLGLHYVWNQQVSGKSLADIQDTANTWLMADIVIVHDWMVKNHFCGHRGKVNVLYADGHVTPIAARDWLSSNSAWSPH